MDDGVERFFAFVVIRIFGIVLVAICVFVIVLVVICVFKDLIEFFTIAEVDLVEIWSLPCQRFDFVEDGQFAVYEIVDDYDVVTRVEKFDDGMRTDIAGATRD